MRCKGARGIKAANHMVEQVIAHRDLFGDSPSEHHGDLVEHLVHNIVAVVAVQYRSCRIVIRQEVDKAVLEPYADCDRSRISGNPFPSLHQNNIMGRREISDTEIVCTKGMCKSPLLCIQIHGISYVLEGCAAISE